MGKSIFRSALKDFRPTEMSANRTDVENFFVFSILKKQDFSKIFK